MCVCGAGGGVGVGGVTSEGFLLLRGGNFQRVDTFKECLIRSSFYTLYEYLV